MLVKIYHNPRCSKSRQTLQLLKDNEIEPEIVDYLNSSPSINEIKEVLTLLNMEPRQLMRKGEQVYTTLKLNDETLSKQDLISAMVENPILIERPIVIVDNNRASICRPPEKLMDLIK